MPKKKMKETKLTDHFPVSKDGKKKTRASKRKEQKDEPPVQPAVSKEAEELELLKQFDLQWEYGPCTGVTRLDRWERAAGHGLNPPEEVKDLVVAHADDERYTQCLWSNYCL